MMIMQAAEVGPSRRDATIGAMPLRFHQVRSDRFEPVVSRGDYVLLAPSDEWRGEGDYLVEVYPGEPDLYRCSACGGTRAKPIHMGSPNLVYRAGGWFVSRAKFEAAVVGIVVMTCKVAQPALLRDLHPAI